MDAWDTHQIDVWIGKLHQIDVLYKEILKAISKRAFRRSCERFALLARVAWQVT
jgi:hypothetical protein